MPPAPSDRRWRPADRKRRALDPRGFAAHSRCPKGDEAWRDSNEARRAGRRALPRIARTGARGCAGARLPPGKRGGPAFSWRRGDWLPCRHAERVVRRAARCAASLVPSGHFSHSPSLVPSVAPRGGSDGFGSPGPIQTLVPTEVSTARCEGLLDGPAGPSPTSTTRLRP
jgi:hypothetical protein